MNRRQFLLAGMGATLLSPLALSSYAFLVEPHWVEVVKKRINIRNLPKTLSGRLLVQLSDLHIGPAVGEGYLKSVFARVSAIAPDYVVYTGDFITYRNAAQLEQLLAMITFFPRGARATLAVLGNHDYGSGWSDARVATRVKDILVAAGITVLRNEAADIGGLTVVGVDDLWARAFDPTRALASWNPDIPSIALCHNPDALDHSGWGKYRGWILAGHTHGGQCKPPFLTPPRLPVANPRYASGEVRLPDGRMLYVNRGVGHLWKVRFNVRPEVSLFTLEAA